MKLTIIGLFLLISLNVLAQQRIFATVSGGDLYSIDLKNCTKDLVGSTGIGFGDIAFTSNGLLWGINNGQLYLIDTLTANTTLIGNTGIGPVSLVGINDTILLAEFQTNLYGINTNDASSYFIGEIGYQANGDLVLIDKSLFMVTPLIKIELNDSYTEIISVSPINLNLPPCQGAASFDNDYLSIIGFSSSGPIQICQIDGSYQYICQDLNLLGVPGSASITSPQYADEIVNIFTPNGDGINDFFQPLEKPNHIKKVTISNRWGNRVAELLYPFIWDGNSESGITLVEGVYYYILEKNDSCNQHVQKQSMIHLIR